MSEQTTYDLPDAHLLQTLDKAHERGFRDFLHHNRHDERCEAHLKQAADAMINLEKVVTGKSVPNYDGSYLAASYLVTYHLKHCILASWAFKRIFDQVGVPNTLYVCDVGAGTGAGRVGLALALSKYSKQPEIYFDSHEPAEAMRSAGNFFWRAFLDSVPDCFNKHYRQYPTPKNPPKLPADTVRVITAFHLSLPWDNQWPSYYWNEDVKPAQNTLEEVFRMVSPDLGVFTIPDRKKKALCRVVDDFYDWDKEFGSDIDIPNDLGIESKSPLYTNCAVDFGFEVPEAEGDPIKSVRHWSRYRFSSPKDSILFLRVSSHYAELLKRERKEAKRKAAEQERLQERKKAEAKRNIDAQEKLKREQSERHPMSYPAGNQREEKERLGWEKLERRWSEEKAERYRRALRLLQPPS
ncbi:MAG: hypothetical protein F4X17_11185 [Gemmatimonadetes bacterium]|nr:hypothetical protein [Gemmatimonadota bacterium]MYI62761.1 hypothetical protein [Gemmatimonadota bacterium]